MKAVSQLAGRMARIVDSVGTDVLDLHGVAIEARELVLGVAVDDLRVARIRDHETRFAAAGRIPVRGPITPSSSKLAIARLLLSC